MGIGKAAWVCADTETAPVIRKVIHVANPHGAVIEVCGLGFFEMYINGKKVSEDRLVPSWSDYGKRDLFTLTYPIHDRFRYRVYYREYDLTDYLLVGQNTLAFVLGNGWFCQTVREAEGKLSYGTPRLAFSLTVDGREILSDGTLEFRDSPIVSNNIYAGEVQDFMHDGGIWRPVTLTSAPEGGVLYPDFCPADRVMRRVTPCLVLHDGERAVFDAGENVSGVVSFVMPKGISGEKTIVRYAERMGGDGTLYTVSAGSIVQTDAYIGDGTERRCEPHFVLHGFRYFEITGAYSAPEVLVIHSDIAVTSAFTSDSAVLNWLYAATVRSLLSNMHSGVISDCPHRERLGYTGDGQLTCETALMLLHSETLYEKWLIDIADGQDPMTGHVQHTAPFYGGGGGPGGWGSAIVAVPYALYRHHGRIDLVARYFENMENWVRYMEAHSENGLVTHEEEGGWCLGEWCTPEDVVLPAPFVNTYFLIKNLNRMIEMAEHIGRDSAALRETAASARQALCASYYDAGKNTFCGGVQGADAFALDIGLGDAEMAASLAAKYDALGEFDTGIFGTEILIRVLFETGYGDTALRLLTSEKENSFGGQMLRCETSLCERWNVRWVSHNHHMFGACTGTLYRYLLGIRADGAYVQISPADLAAPIACEGSLSTQHGRISVSRRYVGSTITFTVLTEVDADFIFRGQRYPVSGGQCRTFVFEFPVKQK